MLARYRAAFAYARSYQGWKMALVGFVCVVFAFGASTSTMPLLYGEVMDEFGWTRTQATLLFTYKNITSAILALFFIGSLFDRFGVRRVMVVSCVLTGLGMASTLIIDSLFTYYFSGVLIGLGVATVLIAAKLFVSRWFVRNLGLAIGLTVVGTSVGGVFFPLVATEMIEAFGWRIAFATLSLGIWFIVLPLYLWVAKDEPTEEEILPEVTHAAASPVVAQRVRDADHQGSFASLLRTPMFWLILAGVFLTAFADSGMFQHTVLLLEREQGYDSRLAAASLSATFALGVVAKVVAGRFFDRYSIRGIQIWYALLAVSILLAFGLHGVLMLVVFTLARGMAHGGLVSSDTAVLAKHCYGPRMMNQTVSVLTGAFAIGSALGPLALSVIHDRTGSYHDGFIAFIAVCVLSVVLLHWVHPHYRRRLEAIAREPARTGEVS